MRFRMDPSKRLRAISGCVRAIASSTGRVCMPMLCVPNRPRASPCLMSRPQPPTIPVSRPSFSRVPPGMRSIHPQKCHGLETESWGATAARIAWACPCSEYQTARGLQKSRTTVCIGPSNSLAVAMAGPGQTRFGSGGDCWLRANRFNLSTDPVARGAVSAAHAPGSSSVRRELSAPLNRRFACCRMSSSAS